MALYPASLTEILTMFQQGDGRYSWSRVFAISRGTGVSFSSPSPPRRSRRFGRRRRRRGRRRGEPIRRLVRFSLRSHDQDNDENDDGAGFLRPSTVVIALRRSRSPRANDVEESTAYYDDDVYGDGFATELVSRI